MEKFKRILKSAEEVICISSLVLTIIPVFINTLCGWIIGRRLGQLEEIALTGFAWITFFSIGYVYKLGSQISVYFLVQLLPASIQKIMDTIITIVIFLSSIYISWKAYILMINAIEKTTPLLGISYFFIDLGAVTGFLLLSLYSLKNLLEKFIKNKCISSSGSKRWN